MPGEFRFVRANGCISIVLFHVALLAYFFGWTDHYWNMYFENERCLQPRGIQFSYLINNVDVCRWASKETSLLIGVTSRAADFKQRHAIRETWGGTSRRMGFKVVFFLGSTARDEVRRQVLEENDLHKDIVQGNFIDTYRNLTYKTVMLIRWACDFCTGASFVLKIDDDMLLSVWDLAVTLNKIQAVRRTMWGWLYRRSKPVRKKTNKWYVSKKEYAPDVYPDFLSGTSYLISGDSVAILANAIKDEPLFPLEDVFLTGIVAQKALVNRKRMAGFFCQHKPFWRPCANRTIVTSHKWGPAMLNNTWKKAVSRLDFNMCKGLKDSQKVV